MQAKRDFDRVGMALDGPPPLVVRPARRPPRPATIVRGNFGALQSICKVVFALGERKFPLGHSAARFRLPHNTCQLSRTCDHVGTRPAQHDGRERMRALLRGIENRLCLREEAPATCDGPNSIMEPAPVKSSRAWGAGPSVRFSQRFLLDFRMTCGSPWSAPGWQHDARSTQLRCVRRAGLPAADRQAFQTAAAAFRVHRRITPMPGTTAVALVAARSPAQSCRVPSMHHSVAARHSAQRRSRSPAQRFPPEATRPPDWLGDADRSTHATTFVDRVKPAGSSTAGRKVNATSALLPGNGPAAGTMRHPGALVDTAQRLRRTLPQRRLCPKHRPCRLRANLRPDEDSATDLCQVARREAVIGVSG